MTSSAVRGFKAIVVCVLCAGLAHRCSRIADLQSIMSTFSRRPPSIYANQTTVLHCFFLIIWRPTQSPLFLYTPLFLFYRKELTSPLLSPLSLLSLFFFKSEGHHVVKHFNPRGPPYH